MPVLSDASFSASQDGFKGDDGCIITLEGDFVKASLECGYNAQGQGSRMAPFMGQSRIRRYVIHPNGMPQVLEAVPIPGPTTSEHTIIIV